MAEVEPTELNFDAIKHEVLSPTTSVLKAASSQPSSDDVALSIGEALAAELAPLRQAAEAIAARLDLLER